MMQLLAWPGISRTCMVHKRYPRDTNEKPASTAVFTREESIRNSREKAENAFMKVTMPILATDATTA